MKLNPFMSLSLACVAIGSAFFTSPAAAQALKKIDVTGAVPTTVAQAQEICAQGMKNTQAVVACTVAANHPTQKAANEAFLAGKQDNSSVIAVVETKRDSMVHLLQLRREQGAVSLIDVSSKAITGGRDGGGRYATPLGTYQVEDFVKRPDESYATRFIDFGAKEKPQNFRGSKVQGQILAFHGWNNQQENQGIFTAKDRNISNGCVRLPLDMYNKMEEFLQVGSSVIVIRQLPALKAAPVATQAQLGGENSAVFVMRGQGAVSR